MIIFKIHILFWFMAFICAFCGLFKNFLYFVCLIIIHELGHFIGAKICHWKVKKIIILPFGGVTIFNEILSKSLFEEFIILVLGPLFQILFYIFFIEIFGLNEILTEYHYALLIFNFLPIFPLDGYKLLNICANKFFSFEKSHLITMVISMITIISIFFIVLIHNLNLMVLLALTFLIIKNIEEITNHNLIFNKFLLERYFYDINFKKSIILKGSNLKKMKREYKHLFYLNKKYETEKSILKKKFDIKQKLC